MSLGAVRGDILGDIRDLKRRVRIIESGKGFASSAGTGTGTSDHGNLVGLQDNDHTQYQLTSGKNVANGYAGLDGSGLLVESQIPAAIARDSEVTGAVTTHEGAANPHPVYATDADLTAHTGAADPHTGYVLESLLDAKGDLYVASAADVPARLAVGNNGQVLMADSAQTLGMRWAQLAIGVEEDGILSSTRDTINFTGDLVVVTDDVTNDRANIQVLIPVQYVDSQHMKDASVTVAKLAAQSVRADKLAVGNFDNLAADPTFERNDESWGVGANTGGNAWTNGTTTVRNGLRAASRVGNGTASTRDYRNATLHDCRTGDEFYASAWFRTAAGTDNGTAQVGIEWLDSTKAVISTSLGGAINPSTSYAESVVVASAPNLAVYARVIIRVNAHGTGTWYADDVYLRRRIIAAFISDAQITAAKISDLTGSRIRVGNVFDGTQYYIEMVGAGAVPLRHWNGTTDNFRLDSDGRVTVTGKLTSTDELAIIRDTAGANALTARATADTVARWRVNSSGVMEWGDGTNPRDISLARGGADVLRLGAAGAGDALQFAEMVRPAGAPAADTLRLYAKEAGTRSALFVEDDAGQDHDFTMPAFLGSLQIQANFWENFAADGWEDWGGAGRLSVAVTKRRGDTRLLVEWGASIDNPTANGFYFDAGIHESVTNARYNVARFWSTANGGTRFYSGVAIISGLAVGAHTLKLQMDSNGDRILADANQAGFLKVWEIPA